MQSSRRSPEAGCGWRSRHWRCTLRDSRVTTSSGQASCLQKLVEGELCVERPEPLPGNVVPWDTDPYRMCDGAAVVEYKGDQTEEPIRSREWKLENL